MNNVEQTQNTGTQTDINHALAEQIRQVITNQRLDNERKLIKTIASDLEISVLDCAAAIAFLWGQGRAQAIECDNKAASPAEEPIKQAVGHMVKFVRYRLDVGLKNKITPDLLKKVLVEESGVDRRNIVNIRIQDSFTLIDLPDEMPQEIFQHLKIFEINNRKLDIKRVKPRKKKRGNKFNRHPGQKNAPAAQRTGN